MKNKLRYNNKLIVYMLSKQFEDKKCFEYFKKI